MDARLRPKPAVLMLASWAVTQVCLLVSGPLVVRSIGVADRGELAIVYAVLLLCSQLALLGLPAGIMYVVSSRSLPAWRVTAAVRTRLGWQLATACLASIGAVIAIEVFGPGLRDPATEAALVGAGVLAVMGALVTQGGLQGEQRFAALALLTPLPAFVYAATLAVLLHSGAGTLPVVLAALLAGWLAQAVLGQLWLRRHRGPRSHGEVPVDEVARFGRRAAVASAAPVDGLGVDQLLVGALLGHAVLGLYVVGAAFQALTLLPLVALSSIVAPQIAVAGSPRRSVAVARRWLVGGAAFGAVGCAAVELVIPVVLPWAFGSAAGDAVPAARLLALTGLVLGLRRLNHAALQALGAPGRSTATELITFVVMIVSITVLGLSHGLLGACLGMVVAGTVAVAIQLVVLHRTSRDLLTSDAPRVHADVPARS